MTKLYFVCLVFLATHSTESASEYNNYKLNFVPSPRDPREIYPGDFNKDGRVFYYHFAPPYEKMKKYKNDGVSRKKFGNIKVNPERRLELIFVNLDNYPKPELVIHPPPQKRLQIYLLGNKNNLEKSKYIESPEVPRHVPEVFFLRSLKKSKAKNKYERPLTILREDSHYEDEGETQNHLHGSNDLFEQVNNFYDFHDAAELKKHSAHNHKLENYGMSYPLPPSPVGEGHKYSMQNYDFGSPPAPAFVLPPGYPYEGY